MSNNNPTPPSGERTPKGEPPWANESRQVATAWLTSFGQAVNALRRDGLARLFHPQAVVFGGHFALVAPCVELDALQFGLVAREAKIAPLNRVYTLITVGWIIRPILEGSPTQHGDATFILYTITPRYSDDDGSLVIKGSIQCVHAHYSRRVVVAEPVIVKANHLPQS